MGYANFDYYQCTEIENFESQTCIKHFNDLHCYHDTLYLECDNYPVSYNTYQKPEAPHVLNNSDNIYNNFTNDISNNLNSNNEQFSISPVPNLNRVAANALSVPPLNQNRQPLDCHNSNKFKHELFNNVFKIVFLNLDGLKSNVNFTT